MSQDKAKEKNFQPLQPVGIFLIFFGAATAAASLLSMPLADKLINLVSGLLLVAIGVFCLWISWRRIRKQNLTKKEP